MKTKDLIGKTIIDALDCVPANKDDEGFIHLMFSDGTEVMIIADYGSYTGSSIGEYPTSIELNEDVRKVYSENCLGVVVS